MHILTDRNVLWGKFTYINDKAAIVDHPPNHDGRSDVIVHAARGRFCSIRYWNWKDMEFHHSPGYNNAKVPFALPQFTPNKIHVILSLGYDRAIKPATRMVLRPNYILHQLDTPQAAAKFNELFQAGQEVILFFHPTC